MNSMIKFGFTRNKDFVVGDLITRRTARLYSYYKKPAKEEGFLFLYHDARNHPEELAEWMLQNVIYFKMTPDVLDFDKRNWEELDNMTK